MADIQDKVVAIIAERTGQKAEAIKMDSQIIADLGADSLDTVEIVMQIEEAFDIKISEEDAQKIRTVGNAVEEVTKKLNSPGQAKSAIRVDDVLGKMGKKDPEKLA